jgi:methionyl-tRNA formyltransferase
LQSLNADLFAVVAFRKLPKIVWSMPEKGTINLHASILPDYRGAAPINWAIINGETVSGATTFFINENIDEGDILLNTKIAIEKTDNAGDLHDKIMVQGSELLVETIDMVEEGSIAPKKQPEVDKPKKAPKIHKEDCKIDWNKNADFTFNFIRGLCPYPTAYTTLRGKIIKIYSSEKNDKTEINLTPGEIFSDNKTELLVGCSEGIIKLIEIQLQGKKRLKVTEFLKGYKI